MKSLSDSSKRATHRDDGAGEAECLPHEFSGSSTIGFAMLDTKLRVLSVNARFAQFAKKPAAACLGKPLDRLVLRFGAKFRTLSTLALQSSSCVSEILSERRSTKQKTPVQTWSVTINRLRATARPKARWICLIDRITDETGVRAGTVQRPNFETFLSDLSAQFVNVPPELVDAEIQNGLKRLVAFLNVDRSSLITAASQDGSATVLGSYAVPGVPELTAKQPFPGFGMMKWYSGQMLKGRTARVRSLEDFPANAHAERAYCKSIGIKSHVGVPISVAGLPLCVLGIATFREERSFPDEFLSRLRLVGEVFANALVRRNAARDLRRIQNEMSHIARISTVGQLAATIAHEINQPLCAILSNAHAAIRLLGAAQPDLEGARDALHDIIADDKRASTIIANAHAMLKRREVESTVLEVNDVVSDVVRLLHSDALIRHVEVRTELELKVPRVRGDRVQLQQVVMNLVLNAMDALSNKNDGRRQVVVRTKKLDDGAHVSVSDTGAGVSAQLMKKIFEPFFTTKVHGLGMGLTITRGIIEAHSGKLWITNRPAPGTTAHFTLPAAHITRN